MTGQYYLLILIYIYFVKLCCDKMGINFVYFLTSPQILLEGCIALHSHKFRITISISFLCTQYFSVFSLQVDTPQTLPFPFSSRLSESIQILGRASYNNIVFRQ